MGETRVKIRELPELLDVHDQRCCVAECLDWTAVVGEAGGLTLQRCCVAATTTTQECKPCFWQ